MVHTSQCHLHDDVNYHKMSLFDMSAFAFENYMQTLKCYIRKSTELVVQVANRICEIDQNKFCQGKERFIYQVVCK